MGFRGRGRGNFRGKGSRGNYNNNNFTNGHVPNYNLNDPYNNPNNYDNYGHTENAIDELFEISKILNTGLDRETLSAALELIELGANPAALGYIL